MTEKNFADFGKAHGEAIREAVKGNADHPGLKDFDAEFIDMAAGDRSGCAPGKDGEGLVRFGETVNRADVSWRDGGANGGLNGDRGCFIGAVVAKAAFGGSLGEAAVWRARIARCQGPGEDPSGTVFGDDGERSGIAGDGAHYEHHGLMEGHGSEGVRVIGVGGDETADGILTELKLGEPGGEIRRMRGPIGRQMELDGGETGGEHGSSDTGRQRVERLRRA